MLKKSVIINAGKIRPIKIKPDYKTIILFTMFLCGLIIGISFTVKFNNDFSGYIDTFFEKILSFKTENNFLQSFTSTFTFYSIFFIILFISGICGVGLPLEILTLIVFGSFCGFSISSYILNYGLNGIGFCALVTIPSYAIIGATLIKCCAESINMSVKIFSYIIGSTNDKNREVILKEFILKYLVFSVPVIIASLLKTAFFQLFHGLFSFV